MHLGRRYRRVLSLAVVVVGAVGLTSHPAARTLLDREPHSAQLPAEQDASWSGLSQLPPHTSVRMLLCDGSTRRTRIQSWSADGLLVVSSGDQVRIDRADISQVVRLSSNRAKRAKLGLLVGATLGAVQGATLVKSNRGQWTVSLAAAWGGIGAAIGAASGGTQESVLYSRQCTYSP